MFELKCPLSVPQCDKATALHFACTQGATEAVKVMLQAYERVYDIVNITDGAFQTPLHKYSHTTALLNSGL